MCVRILQRSILCITLVAALFMPGVAIFGQKPNDAEIKAALVNNFIKYTKPSEESNSEYVRLGYYGENNALGQALSNIQGQKARGKTIKVFELLEISEVTEVDYLFVFPDKNAEITPIKKIIDGVPVVMISDRYTGKREIMINFAHNHVEKKVQFELNLKNIEEAGYTVLPRLLLYGGTELEVRELYKETEASLLSEREKVSQIEEELGRKNRDLEQLIKKQDSLNAKISNYQVIMMEQLRGISNKQKELEQLNESYHSISEEANRKTKILDSTNAALINKNEDIKSLDIELEQKQKMLEEASGKIDDLIQKSLGQKQKIKGQDLLLRGQASQIQNQLMVIIFAGCLALILSIFFTFIYFSYISKKKQNQELEKRNKQIHDQKEQLQQQANQLKKTNVELEELSIVAEKTDNAVIIMNPKAEIEWVNKSFEGIVGCSAIEYFEEFGRDFIKISSEENAHNIIENCLINKQTISYNSHHITKDKRKIWLQTTLTPILDIDREIIKLVAIDSNVTKLKEAAESILKKNSEIEEKAKELLEQANYLKDVNAQLEIQKNRAEEALGKLKDTQSQLLVAEKMASLGQLTSGVAHEINNPINYISSSIEGLMYLVSDVKGLLEQYDTILEGQKDKSYKKLKAEIDYEDLLLGFATLTKNIKMGIDRAKEIVNSLRIFSRADGDVFSVLDIHECVDAVIVLLSKELGDRIKVEKELETDLKLECLPGQINQVFMNIMVNSIQAIPDEGKIAIQACKASHNLIECLKIRFKDTGEGMDQQTINKIFEPFFTTKEVGKGTGLGMSITYSIIKKHHGKITVDSEPGKGTSIIIYLPIKQT